MPTVNCSIIMHKTQHTKGVDFFEIANSVHVPKTDDKVYFEALTYFKDGAIADKIGELMDYDGFKVKVWRVDYQSTMTIISGSLTSIANFAISVLSANLNAQLICSVRMNGFTV